MSGGLIRFPDLVGELGAGGADVDGGANGPPVPASRPRVSADPLRHKNSAARELLRGKHMCTRFSARRRLFTAPEMRNRPTQPPNRPRAVLRCAPKRTRRGYPRMGRGSPYGELTACRISSLAVVQKWSSTGVKDGALRPSSPQCTQARTREVRYSRYLRFSRFVVPRSTKPVTSEGHPLSCPTGGPQKPFNLANTGAC